VSPVFFPHDSRRDRRRAVSSIGAALCSCLTTEAHAATSHTPIWAVEQGSGACDSRANVNDVPESSRVPREVGHTKHCNVQGSGTPHEHEIFEDDAARSSADRASRADTGLTRGYKRRALKQASVCEGVGVRTGQ
jgi:hypothetical protein